MPSPAGKGDRACLVDEEKIKQRCKMFSSSVCYADTFSAGEGFSFQKSSKTLVAQGLMGLFATRFRTDKQISDNIYI